MKKLQKLGLAVAALGASSAAMADAPVVTDF